MTPSEPLLRLIEMVLVVTAVIADLMLCTRWFKDTLSMRFSLKNRSILIVVFGAISVYGTYSGIDVHDATVNIRDLGPMVAGLIGGPLVGFGAGLIGGMHRYFLGGFTSLPCSLATMLAGLTGGAIFLVKKSRLVTLNEAVVFAVAMESFHMLLVLLLARPYLDAVKVVQETVLPMIMANVLGIVIFVLTFSHGIKEIEREDRFLEHIAMSVQKNNVA